MMDGAMFKELPIPDKKLADLLKALRAGQHVLSNEEALLIGNLICWFLETVEMVRSEVRKGGGE